MQRENGNAHRLLAAAVREARRYAAQPWYDRLYIAALVSIAIMYVLTSFIGGGDALHGRRVDGHYFVAHNEGAPEHEVSPFLYEANLWLFRSIGGVVLARILVSLALRFRGKMKG